MNNAYLMYQTLISDWPGRMKMILNRKLTGLLAGLIVCGTFTGAVHATAIFGASRNTSFKFWM